MRISFLMPADDLTGGNRVIATYARLLQARGHEVVVVSNAPAPLRAREFLRLIRRGCWRELRQRLNPPAGHIGISGVPHRTLECARPITAEDVPDADIVVATWWETAVWMHQLPATKGHPVHLIQGYEIWGGNAVRDQVHLALNLPNLKIAISTGLKTDIEAALGDLGICVVPNAVDVQQFDAPPRGRQEIPTVGFIYSRASIKGVDRCLRAIDVARSQLPALRVIAFGTETPGKELPLPAGTFYRERPTQNELADLYAQCDAWLFASRLDSFGLPILEAMACRTPVIGVPTGAAADLLSRDCGYLLPPSDEDTLVANMASALVELCQMQPDAWRAMSDAAYAKARSYSWEDACDHLEDLLGRLLPTAPNTV